MSGLGAPGVRVRFLILTRCQAALAVIDHDQSLLLIRCAVRARLDTLGIYITDILKHQLVEICACRYGDSCKEILRLAGIEIC